MTKCFSGTLFKPDLADGKAAVDVSFSESSIELFCNGVSTTWNANEVTASIGGSSNHLVFFVRKNSPEESFFLPLNPELKLALKSFPKASWYHELQASLASETRSKILWGSLALVPLLLIVGIVFSREMISKKVVRLIPFEIEQMIGDRLIGTVLPTHSRVYDEDILKHLGETLEPLRQSLPPEYREFKFYVASDPQVNAFAIPGGHIVFNMGALKVSNDASELLGVAAHELAHVTQRHSMRNIIQGAGIFVLLQAFFGDVTGIIAVIADQGSFLLNQSFSRSMETDADKKGFEYMVTAKIDPRGMSRFFQHVLKQPNVFGEAGKKAERTLEFLSTHPNTEDRIKQIDSAYLALSEETKSAFRSDLDSFKALKQRLSQTK